MKSFIKTILEWAIMVAVCYVLVELGIFSCVAKIMGVIAYLGIGCLISLFAADHSPHCYRSLLVAYSNIADGVGSNPLRT